MRFIRLHSLLRVTVVAVFLGGCVASQPSQPVIKEWKGHITTLTGTPSATRAVDRSAIPPLTDRLLPPFKNQRSAGKQQETFSVVVRDTPVDELLFALARDGELDLTLHPDIKGKVTLKVTNRPLIGILDAVAEQVPLRYEIEGSRVSVLPDAPYWRTYRIDYINITRSATTTSVTGSSTGTLGGSAGGSSSGGGTSSGSGASGGSTSGGSGGSSGGANTTLNEQSTNLFWSSLESNLQAIMKTTEPAASSSSTSSGSSSGSASASSGASSAGTTASGTSGGSATASTTGTSSSSGGAPASGSASSASGSASSSGSSSDSRIIINRETGIINVHARRTTHGQVSRFLGEVLQSARRQVLIEATIVEVALDDKYETGIDWGLVRNNLTTTQTVGNGLANATSGGYPTAVGNVASLGSSALLSGITTPFFTIGYSLFKSRFGSLVAAARLLDQFGQSRILSSPRLMAMNNQSATLKVVDNQVYFTLEVKTSENMGTTTTTTTTVTSKMNNQPTGFMMLVTPFITEAGNVTLNVRPTLSRITEWKNDVGFTVAAQAAGITGVSNQVPIIEVREMESMLHVQSGDIAILGGLIVDSQIDNQRGVPGLKDAPGIGRVFRHDAKQTRKTELVIFLRPVIGGNVQVGDHIAQGSAP